MTFPKLHLPLAPQDISKPLVVIALLVFLQYAIPNSVNSIALYFDLVRDGEYWRIISGNLIHSGHIHLLFNCLGVLLVWLLYAERFDTTRYLGVIFVGCLFVGIGETYLSNYDSYRGFSGVLHGLLLFGAIADIKRKDTFGWMIFVIIAGKIVIENTTNMSIFAGAIIDDSVAVTSHLFGGIAGAMLSVFLPPVEIKHK